MTQSPKVLIRIDNLAFGGDGVGEVVKVLQGDLQLNGIRAFVPFSVPGEVVEAIVVEQKPRYLRAKIEQITEPSPQRVTPRCPYFMRCGGCELQHISYEQQLISKHEMLKSALRVAGHNEQTVEMVEPIVAGKPFGYRQRISLHVDQGGKVGFFQAQSRDIVELAQCPIAAEVISEALQKVKQLAPHLKGIIPLVLLEADDQGVVCVLKAAHEISSLEHKEIVAQTKRLFDDFVLNVQGRNVAVCGRDTLSLPLDKNGQMLLRAPTGGFSQVNQGINIELISAACQNIKPKEGKVVLDLYSGAGNFSLPLAQAGCQVTAVECDVSLVRMGKQNATEHSCEGRLEFVQSSVEEFLKKKGRKPVDVLLLDPPRSGLGKLVEKLPQAKQLVLVSCHLPSFVRDAKELRKYGWDLVAIKPFDMFSQTSYLEIMSVFAK